MITDSHGDIIPNHSHALTYHNLGLSVVAKMAGGKRPVGRWQTFQQRLPTAEEISQADWSHGCCLICGRVSGNLEALDFDQQGKAFAGWFAAVEKLNPELAARLVIQRTQSDGRHVLYRCPEGIEGNQSLAKNAAGVLIETRGEGGLIVAASSPGYWPVDADGNRIGDALAEPPTLTADERELLLNCARMFDERPAAPEPSRPRVERDFDELTPGDDYNERGDVRELLQLHGWRFQFTTSDGEAWCRPGKASGVSGKLFTDSGLFYVYSSNAMPLEANRSYDPFGLFAQYEHNGDYAAAAGELRRQGYCGEPTPVDLTGIDRQSLGTDGGSLLNGKAPWNRKAGPVTAVLVYRPFPVEVLPATLRAFVRSVADCCDCDPAYVALPSLAVLASLIGTTHRLRLKNGWDVACGLWCVVVGDSGSGKSPAMSHAKRPLEELDYRAFRDSQRATATSVDLSRFMKSDEQPPTAAPVVVTQTAETSAVRHVVSDMTIESVAPILLQNPRGLLCARDELAGWFGSFNQYKKGGGGSDEANWLSLWSAGDLRVDRKTGEPRTIIVPDVLVSVCGTIQPGTLRDKLSADRIENGLAARLLIASPPWRSASDEETELDETATSAYRRLVEKLAGELQHSGDVDGRLRPHIIRLDDAARGLWREFRKEHRREMDDLDSALRGVWSKLQEYAARLAMVVHFSRWAEPGSTVDRVTLDAASLNAGITLARWFGYEARRLHAVRSGESSPLDTRLVDWLQAHPGSYTVRELSQRCRAVKELSADSLRQRLRELADLEVVRWIGEPGGSGARIELVAAVETSPQN